MSSLSTAGSQSRAQAQLEIQNHLEMQNQQNTHSIPEQQASLTWREQNEKTRQILTEACEFALRKKHASKQQSQPQMQQNAADRKYQSSYQPQVTIPNEIVQPSRSPPLPPQPRSLLSFLTLQDQAHPTTSTSPSSTPSSHSHSTSISSPSPSRPQSQLQPLHNMPNPHPTPPSSPPQPGQA